MSVIKEKTTTWYTIKVQANRERSVAERLRVESEKKELRNVKQILVPMEKVYHVKDGKRVSRDKITYPGYVFVEVDMIGELQWALRQIPGNSGLLTDRSGNLLPMKESEINRMMGRIEESHVSNDTSNAFMVNEIVMINNGAFSGFKATIEEIHHDKKKAKLAVSIFGRLTYMDLDIDQIDKINE